MFKSLTFRKVAILGAAALALGTAVLPVNDAEARWRGHRRGAYIGAGVLGGALLGGALLAPRAYAAPGYYAPAYAAPGYYDEPSCYIVRKRVWDEYRGHWVRVKQRVCE